MRSLKVFSALALATLLFAGILTQWVPYRWATGLFQTGAFALAICWAARLIFEPFALKGSILVVPLSAAAAWGLAQLALGQSVYRQETWDSVLQWGANLTLFFLSLQIFSDAALRERFLRAILYFAVVLSVFGCIQMFTSNGRIFWLFPAEFKDYVVGPFVYHTQFAGFIELILPLAVVGALEDRQKRLPYAAIAATLYASVIASASRAGMALVSAEVLTIFAVALLRGRATRRSLALTLGLLTGFALLLTGAVGWVALWQRFLLADPYAVRREFLQSSLAMIHDRPWMGFGLGTWSTAYPAYATFDNGLFANRAHNDWAQWTVEGGVPFLIFMLWIAARSVGSAMRSLWGIGAAAVFAHSFIDYPLGRPALAGFIFVFVCVI